jgi:hypothetical protein
MKVATARLRRHRNNDLAQRHPVGVTIREFGGHATQSPHDLIQEAPGGVAVPDPRWFMSE